MTSPRLLVLVEAGSNTTSTATTTNNSDIANTIKSMLIRLLQESGWKPPGLLVESGNPESRGKCKALDGRGRGVWLEA